MVSGLVSDRWWEWDERWVKYEMMCGVLVQLLVQLWTNCQSGLHGKHFIVFEESLNFRRSNIVDTCYSTLLLHHLLWLFSRSCWVWDVFPTFLWCTWCILDLHMPIWVTHLISKNMSGQWGDIERRMCQPWYPTCQHTESCYITFSCLIIIPHSANTLLIVKNRV